MTDDAINEKEWSHAEEALKRLEGKARAARKRLMKFLNGSSPYKEVVICDFCSHELMPIWKDVRAALDGGRGINE